MPFVLAEQRDEDVVGAFKRYRDYLGRVRADFPRSAFELAMSDWYFSGDDLRTPHDARLDSVTISEISAHARSGPRSVSIRIKLSLAHGGRPAEFYYPEVFSYTLDGRFHAQGHCDWRYDEFRLTAPGRVVHEIEWCGAMDTGRWLIEASDVEFVCEHPGT